jgi:hypothetical protein
MARGRQARLQIGGDATALHTASLMMRVSFLFYQKTDKDLEWIGAKLREHKQMYPMGAHCTGLESAFTIRRLTGLNRKNVRCRLSGRIAHARKGNRPRGDCFDVALYFIRPEGAGQDSPGQRPGDAKNERKSPVRGATADRRCVALSGLCRRFGNRRPGRCPGLICSAPSGQGPKQRNIKRRS